MESYQGGCAAHISAKHRRALFEESGISPEIVAERGYWTVRSRAELLDFKKYQRRAPALYVPMCSPDGAKTGAQLRPDNPRRDRKGKPIKYETAGGSRCILDVHPRNMAAVRDASRRLWVTEGVKKGDALASRGEVAVSLIGVWNWQRGGDPLPCWEHVELSGREVLLAFDSDVMVKEGVRMALERLVGLLEDRGADVRVVYLPEGEDGEKVGVDDYLAAKHAGGTVAELKALARKFEPRDLGRVRLSRDDRLRALVEDLRSRWWAEEWKGGGGYSDRDIAHVLIEAAGRSGATHPDGVRVVVSWGELEVRAKVSRGTVAKALNRLEERGFLYRDNDGRKAEKPGAFVLRAKVYQYGEKGGQEGKVTQGLQAYDPGGIPLRAQEPDVPRLRWSRPAYTPKKRGFAKGTRRVRESKPLPARERVERLGKVRGAVVDVLQAAGGELALRELCGVLNKKRPRDVRRRVLPMLEEAGIIEVAGDVIRLAREWREALEAERLEKGEVEADELAEDRRKRKSRAYRNRDNIEPGRHYVNVGADGHVEDLRQGDIEPEEEPPEREEAEVSELARAIREYLDRSPADACQPPGWIGVTLWAHDLYPGPKPTPAEVRAAVEELGGERYLRDSLRRSAEEAA